MMKRVVLADDHAMMLEGITSILQADCEVVGTAANGRALIEMAVRLKPDLIVLDVSLPLLNGIEAARRIAKILPAVKLVFVTQQLDSAYIRAAFESGAAGYVAKQSAGKELREAIRLAFLNRYYVTPLATAKEPEKALLRNLRTNPADMFGGQLTPRQREVLQLIAEGKTIKEISSALNISGKTVEFHRNGLMNELGLRTTAELTRYAMTHGIIGD
jgi:DNA-binding NarL/FixJ family response regulator